LQQEHSIAELTEPSIRKDFSQPRSGLNGAFPGNQPLQHDSL
jgi:hypothetical protein